MEHTDAELRQFRRMTETPVPGLVISLAIPTIFTMLITSFYNMADTFFVARLGTSAAGAVGIVFAIMASFRRSVSPSESAAAAWSPAP